MANKNFNNTSKSNICFSSDAIQFFSFYESNFFSNNYNFIYLWWSWYMFVNNYVENPCWSLPICFLLLSFLLNTKQHGVITWRLQNSMGQREQKRRRWEKGLCISNIFSFRLPPNNTFKYINVSKYKAQLSDILTQFTRVNSYM